MANEKLDTRQLKQKISSQKGKIESLESTYEAKIELLESRKDKLESKAHLGVSSKIIPGATKKAEEAIAELEKVNNELEKVKEERDKKLSEAKKVLSELKVKRKESTATDRANSIQKAKLTEEKIKQNLFWYSILVAIVGLILAIIALCLLGSMATIVLAIIALVFSAIAAIYPIPTFIKQRKAHSVKTKTWISLIATGIVIAMSVIALILNPVIRSAVIAEEEAKAAEELAELAEKCRKSFANVESNWQCSQSEYENEDFYYTTDDLRKECSNKGRRWDDDEYTCLSQVESNKIIAQEKAAAEESKLKSECSAKSYDWNYDAKRCNTAEEQKAKEAEREAERKRQEEANKTTTITGKDHDANDMAGKFSKLADACWDKLDEFWTAGGTVILDSDSGSPISYSVTIKGDGTLVKGTMTGNYRTKGGKVKPLYCTYDNGTVKITGID